MPSKLENSQVATGQENVSFHSSPKKGNDKDYSNYCSVVLISHASKVCSKSFKAGFKSTWIKNFQKYTLYLEKAEEPYIK